MGTDGDPSTHVRYNEAGIEVIFAQLPASLPGY
jgi:hypothetical protein